jgi:hypothetical protein
MIWVGNIALVEEMIKEYNVLIGKPEQWRLLRKPVVHGTILLKRILRKGKKREICK